MKSISYPDIVRSLREKHEEFFNKYRLLVEKNVNERILERGTLLARLKLIAEAMRDAGAIASFQEMEIIGHSNSLALIPKYGSESTYLLNDGSDFIVVCGGVASEDALTGRIVLSQGLSQSARHSFFRRYSDVLSDDFDWKEAALTILEAIHETAYNRRDVQRDFFLNATLNGS